MLKNVMTLQGIHKGLAINAKSIGIAKNRTEHVQNFIITLGNTKCLLHFILIASRFLSKTIMLYNNRLFFDSC